MRRLLPMALAAAALGSAARAQLVGGVELPEVDWEQRLGERLPLETTFVDADGRPVTLGECFGERPVILALVYYECPMLCDLVLAGLVRALKPVDFSVGEEFDVVAISIDPGEHHDLARAKREGYAARYDRAGGEDGWRFLVGGEASIRAVADAVGFEYAYVPQTDEYAHAAGVVVLTPEGEVSRYFYGVEFSPRDLRFGLMDAARGAIGSPVDKLVLRCFHYDPAKGRYGFAIMNTIRVLGIGTLALLVGFVVRMLLRERRRREAAAFAAAEEAS